MKLELHRPHQETLGEPFIHSRLDKVAVLSLKIERGANLDALIYILHVFEMKFAYLMSRFIQMLGVK